MIDVEIRAFIEAVVQWAWRGSRKVVVNVNKADILSVTYNLSGDGMILHGE